jgi:hypothetical protein
MRYKRLIEYPSWSSGFLRPFSLIAERGVGEEQELSYNTGERDLRRFSCADESLIFFFHGRVEADGDEGRYIEGLPEMSTPSEDEALAATLSRIAGDWR